MYLASAMYLMPTEFVKFVVNVKLVKITIKIAILPLLALEFTPLIPQTFTKCYICTTNMYKCTSNVSKLGIQDSSSGRASDLRSEVWGSIPGW